MTDMRTWSRDFIIEFIELYRSLPCLYDLKSKQYFNKALKLAAYNKLVKKLRTVYPKATKDTVVSKINNLRSSYRKELKKIIKSRSESTGKYVYKTSLWYFHYLDFLYEHDSSDNKKPHLQSQESNNSDDNTEEMETFPEPTENDLDVEVKEELILSEGAMSPFDLASSPTDFDFDFPSLSNSATATRKPKKYTAGAEEQKAAADTWRTQSKYCNYAIYVGQELEGLPPMMATYCQKIINDALFEAKCGQLTAESRIVTGGSDKKAQLDPN